MYLPIEKIKPGKIYRTGNSAFPYAYLMRVVFENAIENGLTFPDTPHEYDQIVCRFYHNSGSQHYASHEYFDSYASLEDKKFIEELDLPLKYDNAVNQFYVQLDKNNSWDLINMCFAVWQGSRIYSQANPYKFKHRILIGKETYMAMQSRYDIGKSPEIVNLLTNVIGLDKFVHFTYLANASVGVPCYTGTSLHFYSEEDYNLARLSLPST